MIYIQSNNEKTLAHHFDCSCALYGAIETGQKYKLITFKELDNKYISNLMKTNLFVGSVEFMNKVFNTLNLYNIRLPKNSNRECEIITLKEAYTRISDGKTKLFIKPVDIKLFTGFIFDNSLYTCLNNIDENIKIFAYEPFQYKILSEWRLYIYNNIIIDSRNYSGDFKICPDYQYAIEIIKENKNSFPCAYTIDIGILSNNENVVIEFNDMWAIGNYGIPNDDYLKLLKARYFEIIKN